MADTPSVRDVRSFCAQALAVVADAAAVLNAATSIATGGRYDAAGASIVTTEADVISVGTSARAAVRAAAEGALAALPAQLPGAVIALIGAAIAAVPNPADQLRCCFILAGASGSSPVGLLCRRMSVAALAVAAAAYKPNSYDDAQAVLGQLADLLDAEISTAGDVGDDASYAALRALRVSVVADLLARGASLAPLVLRHFGANLPALVLAQTLYGDATREADLVRRVPDWPHPLFMPTDLQVLGR